MRTLPLSIIPNWLQVLHVLHRLGDDERVTLATYRRFDEPAWHWAVAQRAPGPARIGHAGHSPWLQLVSGRTARSLRRIAPLWVAEPQRWPVTAEELEHLALTDPSIRQRMIAANHVAELLLHQPEDWSWIRKTIDRLHPDAPHHTDDLDEGPWEERPRGRSARPSVRQPESRRPLLPRPADVVQNASAEAPSVPVASTRPSLRYRRPPSAPSG